MMLVAIPTLGRTDDQLTIEQLPGRWQDRARLVCPPDEADALGDRAWPCPVSGIAAVRQWVLDECPEPFVCFLDDDMRFSRRDGRTSKGTHRLRRASRDEVGEMLDLLEGWLAGGFVHVGVSAANQNWYAEAPWAEVTRMNNAYAYDVGAVAALGARFDRLPVMEDFDMTLQLLRLGLPNRVSYEFAWGQRGSNLPGGCSTYRTNDMQAEGAHGLRRLHGADLVTLVRAKKDWPGMPRRQEVRISWRRAYEQALSGVA
jgi:hypothetical protein